MRRTRLRITLRQSMAAVFLLEALLAAVRLANDPMEIFHRRTGLRRPDWARVIASRWIGDHPEFRLAFDTDPEAVSDWLSSRPAEDWRGWFGGRIPDWITGPCPFARAIFAGVPIDDPDSPSVRFAFRVSWVEDHQGELIVIDPTIGRVWFCSWRH